MEEKELVSTALRYSINMQENNLLLAKALFNLIQNSSDDALKDPTKELFDKWAKARICITNEYDTNEMMALATLILEDEFAKNAEC